MKKKEILYAFQQSVPVLLGYIFLGLAFGLMLQNAGYHFVWAFLISLTVYAGSMQFVLVTLLSGAYGLLYTFIMTLFINGRHIFYGLSFVEKFKKMGKAYPYMVFSLTDETYSVLCSLKVPAGMDEKKVSLFIAMFDHSYWIIGSVLGAVVGQLFTGAVDFLVQGTIYPDVVESGLGGESAVIKSHHNVGGLPDCVDFKEIIEPLRNLFKDEVRKVGLELGIPEHLVFRQPFPGPGLGIRIIGEVTAEKVKIVQDADAIYREEIANAGLDRSINQYFAALTNMRSVGVMGDERTYDYAIALRAVNTIDFMTAESAQIPWEVLQKVTSRIINEVSHVNRVMYDITSKPPGTIEFE